MEISLENILMRGQWSWQLAWRKDYDESLFNEIRKSQPEKLGNQGASRVTERWVPI